MMTAPSPSKHRRVISEASVPALSRGTRLRYDEAREKWVLLVPERVMAPDPIAVEILKLCDSDRSVADIVDNLAERYAAPREEIAGDVIAMLQDLADSGHLTEKREHPL